MAGRAREPQSYGSGSDWTKGTTGQEVNDPKAVPEPEHREFYEDRRESETTGPSQGGENSPVVAAEQDSPGGTATEESSPVTGVTMQEGGARRDSFFRKRDYE